MGLRVHLKRQAKSSTVDAVGVKRLVRSVLRGEEITEGGVTIVLTDNPGIRSLNARFRNQDKPTDVLAFPLDDTDDFGVYLGDVVVSVDRAREQAPRFNNDFDGELARLIIHGILHLLGYDHHTPLDGKKMKARERAAHARFIPGSLVQDEGSV